MPNSIKIDYQLQPHSISQHLFKVVMNVPTVSSDVIDLTLPAWIPGSYMIRDFAKNICELKATNEQAVELSVEKTDKQTWRVINGGNACQITYFVYAFDLSVRSAYLNDEFGFINGTSAFLQVKQCQSARYNVSLVSLQSETSSDWRVVTGMPKTAIDDDGYGDYSANSYAELIDFPILFGRFNEESFKQDGIDFKLVFTGNAPLDMTRITNDLKPILHQQVDLFKDTPPIKEYLFITLLTQNGFGGLEHKNSTVLMFSRWDLPVTSDPEEKTKSYRDFLALCSHEFLHTWHVKRTRPQVLLAPDLSHEAYTNQLWIYEGFTSFYDDLALARAGSITPQQYLEIVGKNITRLLRNSGRLKQSAAASSFDAWTRFYQQDANSINHIVSYYTKGGLIALCLDVFIRENSNQQYSLDNVMRDLWQQFGKSERGTPDDVIAPLIEKLIGKNPQSLLDSWVYSPGELPLASMLNCIGVNYHERYTESLADLGGTDASNKTLISLGISVKASDIGLTVIQVREDSICDSANIIVNDRLIALNNWQLNETNLPRLVSTLSEGENATVHLLRDGRLIECQVTYKKTVFDTCYLSVNDENKLSQWLGLEKH